jgi:DNA-binding CsgD family transcriptional regulator
MGDSVSHSFVLTQREAEVFHLIGMGKTTKEIATALDIRPGTVGEYRKSLCRWLDLHSTAELVAAAVRYTIEQQDGTVIDPLRPPAPARPRRFPKMARGAVAGSEGK